MSLRAPQNLVENHGTWYQVLLHKEIKAKKYWQIREEMTSQGIKDTDKAQELITEKSMLKKSAYD